MHFVQEAEKYFSTTKMHQQADENNESDEEEEDAFLIANDMECTSSMTTSIAIKTEYASSMTLEEESQIPSDTIVYPVLFKFDIPLDDEHVINDLL